MVAVLGLRQVHFDEPYAAHVAHRHRLHGGAHVERLHREPRHVARITGVLQQNTELKLECGPMPDVMAALPNR